MCCSVEVDAESYVLVKRAVCDDEMGVVCPDGIDTCVGVGGKCTVVDCGVCRVLEFNAVAVLLK